MVADRSKFCIERYWEVVGELSISATHDPPNSPNWGPQTPHLITRPRLLPPRGTHKYIIHITAKRWQMENNFMFIGTVKS